VRVETTEREYEWVVNEVIYDYAVVLTQECDLEQDYNYRTRNNGDHDKYIPMILMAPAYLAESLRRGDHLTGYGQQMQRINSDDWGKVKRNGNKRYHYLKMDVGKNVPELVIDFKHFFTMSRDMIYNKVMDDSYKASLTILYREDLSQRFCNFISRIAIPDNLREAELLTESLCRGVSSEPS
jgi:hypothetical protein